MEWKGASVVVMVVILLITGNAIADEPCFQQCLNNCDKLPVLCVRLCLGKCPPDPNLPQNPVDLSHYYCKIGCSLHQCHKFSHDKEKMGSCMQDCSYTNSSAPYCQITPLSIQETYYTLIFSSQTLNWDCESNIAGYGGSGYYKFPSPGFAFLPHLSLPLFLLLTDFFHAHSPTLLLAVFIYLLN